MSNVISFYVVRPGGRAWRVSSPDDACLAGAYSSQQEAWEAVLSKLYKSRGVAVLYGDDNQIEWVVRHTPRADGDPRPCDNWVRYPQVTARRSFGGAA